MGKKIVGLYCTLCVLSVVLISISCFNKWHQVTFQAFGVKTLFRLETSLTHATVPGTSKIFCGIFRNRQSKRCGEFQEGVALQEIASKWCAKLATILYPTACEAFNKAYISGLAVILTYAMNIILLCTSAYLLWHYLESKSHKPVYRMWALILHAIASILMAGAVASYGGVAIKALDAMGGGGLPFVFDASQSVGVSPGYFLVWLGVLLQFAALGLHACMRVDDEETEDDRLYKDLMKEQERYGALEEQAKSFQQASEAGYPGYDAQAASWPAGYDPSQSGHSGYDAGYDPSGQYAYQTPNPGAAYPTGGVSAAMPQPPQPQPTGMPAAPAPGPEVPQPGQAAW